MAGIDAFTSGECEVDISTVKLCPVRDIGVPTLVERDMVCEVGVPNMGGLGLLVTKPMLSSRTVILPTEVGTFFFC